MTEEQKRLDDTTHRRADWKLWGPYLSERAWGSVREDYSADGDAWSYFPHDHARSRTYRWNEDGLAGICDREQGLCFALALWNGNDPFLKERLFGLSGHEGNHGEDVKEAYFHLDNTPTHSYMKMLYKYPQGAFPYEKLVEENQRRGRLDPEFELPDTGAFDEDRYFDVFIEYAKAGERDILIRIRAINRGPEPAELHLLPHLWFRNTWSWERSRVPKPNLHATNNRLIEATHPTLGKYRLYCEDGGEFLFTENESNTLRLFDTPNRTPHVKDGIDEAVVQGRTGAVNAARRGTKAAVHYRRTLRPGQETQVCLRLTDTPDDSAFSGFDETFEKRINEADAFYRAVRPPTLSDDEANVQRQAFAGLLWHKQWYHFNVREWLEGDPAFPKPPAARRRGRNREWTHLDTYSVLSMPDKWEYPWFAAWDLAFHCVPLAVIDPAFAKRQLILMLREWFMHPNGQLPAYEWEFGDVNPPVHAWAAWRVYKIEKKQTGKGDTAFLERIFHKLLLNFTWWVNRKDTSGNNVFEGGFLGMDNIGVFDRSAPLPTGGRIEQSDGTSWMGMYCLNLMTIALELARYNRVYEDVATKFFEHFMYIAQAMNNMGGEGVALWDEDDEFFFDVLHLNEDEVVRLKIRSMVGLVPLLAVETLEPDLFEILPNFKRRMDWFLSDRPEMADLVSRWEVEGAGHRHLLALLRGHRMKRVLSRMLDTNEFLSDHGIRALSKYHKDHPYVFRLGDTEHRVDYEPGESTTGLFGGNSNWRGPIWMPMNYMIIEALQKFDHYYSDDFRIEFPTGSGKLCSIRDVAHNLARRLISILLRDPKTGKRPAYGNDERLQSDPHWQDCILFHEFFHGDTGEGLGASHQTGWTALIAKLIQQCGEDRTKHAE